MLIEDLEGVRTGAYTKNEGADAYHLFMKWIKENGRGWYDLTEEGRDALSTLQELFERNTGNVLEQAAQRRLLTGRQLGFFDSGEDTPLFSGVAQEAKEEVFAPEPEDVNAQLSLFDIPELQPQMGRRTPPPINRVIGYLSSDESRPISLIEDASMLAKDFRTIAVSINGQEILATEGQNYHNEIIRKYDKKLNEDYFVRFKANSGFLMTADYYAGVINLITESDRVKALNNIYAALDKMVARGLDPSTPVDIYRHGLSVIHTTAGDVTGNVLEQPMNPVGDVQPGTVPQPQFEGELLQEVNEDYVNPMVNRMKEAYKANMGRQFKMSDMPANIQKEMHTYLNQVNNDLSSTKLAAVRYGEQMRDAALLNYSRRYGFDQYLNLVFPYQFWYTRSLMNWATRMVDKPVWFSMYARLRRIQEEQERKGMPSRLRGKIRLAMPWLPEWMGGGVWQDPMKQLLPFSQFFQPIEQAAVNNNQLHRRTEQILYDMVEQDQISTAELNTALNDQEGNVWDRAFKQAEMELDINSNPATLVSTLMQPALWWTIPSKLMQGKGEEISVLPITRTGQSLKTATEGTMLEGIGKFAGGVLAGPEEYIREKSGLSKYGEWGDYYVDRQIANLVADGEVSVEEGLRAMIERTGEAYDLAMQRVNQEMMLRTPGTLPILAIKEGASPVEVAAAIISSLFPSGLFPTGELEMRNLKAEYDAAWKRFHAGDEEAINTFWDEHPEYEARLALYDEPEERLRQFLVNEIWDKYTQLESANKTAAVDQLGEEFEQSFLNEETQSYDSTDIKTLAVWAQLLGSSLPSVEEVSNLPESQPLELYEPELLTAVDEYYAERDKLFPLATGWQSIYFSLSPTERKAFLKQYPKLKDYWEWNDEYKQEHPDIADYLTERYGSQESYLEDVNDLTAPLTRALLQYYMVGKPLTSGARAELQRIWLMNGSKGGSLDDYTQQLVLTIFGG